MWTPSTRTLFILTLLVPSTDGLLLRWFLRLFRGDFEMTVDYSNVPLFDRLFFFRFAIRKFERIIQGDVTDVSDNRLPTFPSTDCGQNPSEIDDVYVCVSYKIIDGPGGIAAVGYGALYRGTFLPMTASLEFESEDIDSLKDSDIFRASILSEMSAMLGLNQFAWEQKGLIAGVNATLPCVYGFATNAGREWRSISGCDDSVPVEASFPGNSVLQCGHWDETCLQKEILTPTVQSDRIISAITVGAFQDMGYDVNYRRADSFSSGSLDSSCACNRGTRRNNVRKLSKGPSRRRLSEESYQRAVEYGQSVIKRLSPSPEEARLVEETGEIVVGKAAQVLVLEEGELYSVIATA